MSFPLAGCSKRDLKDSCALALPRSLQQLQLLHSSPSSHPNEDGGRTRKELIEWDGGIFQGRPLIPPSPAPCLPQILSTYVRTSFQPGGFEKQ